MSLDAVALLRIPGFAPEDADVRELEDGFLLFLDVPYEDDPDGILDAIVDAIGDALEGHDDERGIFVLPDAAEPAEATSYAQVIAEVGDAGMFIAPDDESEDGDPLAALGGLAGLAGLAGPGGPGGAAGGADGGLAAMQGLLGQMFEALGAGSADNLAKALQSGDPDALKLAQVRMMGAAERAMGSLSGEAPPGEGPVDDGATSPTSDAKDSAPKKDPASEA